MAALADSLSLAFLVLLERLTPVERAVFLLHEVFDYPYEEIAGIVEKSAANCRQIGQRARRHIHADRPRFDPSPAEQERLTQQFVESCTTRRSGCASRPPRGRYYALVGQRREGAGGAAPDPRCGECCAVPYRRSSRRRRPDGHSVHRINGQPGVIVRVDDSVYVTVLDIADGRIQAIRVIANPDKLRGLVRSSQ